MYPDNLAALAHNFGMNKPGICSMRAVPKDKVSLKDFISIMKDTSSSNYPLTGAWIGIAIGYDWLDISKLANVNVELIEGDELTPQGKLFTYQLVISIPNDDHETRGKILLAYDNREWIVQANLRSGSKRLIGSQERGADFKAQMTSGIPGKQNVYQCGFEWKSPVRAHYVE